MKCQLRFMSPKMVSTSAARCFLSFVPRSVLSRKEARFLNLARSGLTRMVLAAPGRLDLRRLCLRGRPSQDVRL